VIEDTFISIAPHPDFEAEFAAGKIFIIDQKIFGIKICGFDVYQGRSALEMINWNMSLKLLVYLLEIMLQNNIFPFFSPECQIL
jgi:hypothetical protein